MCCQKSKIFEIYGCDLLNAAEGTGIEKVNTNSDYYADTEI